MRSRLAWAGALALLALAACIPPRLPPQLAATPGPPVIVADRVYVANLFSVQAPPGWTLITGPAASAPQVVFVAPDSRALIAFGVGAGFTAPELAQAGRSAVRTLALDSGLRVEAALRAPSDGWAAYVDVFARVIASLRAEMTAAPPG
jgi:hypothetical protein